MDTNVRHGAWILCIMFMYVTAMYIYLLPCSLWLLQTYLKEILKEICVYNMKAPHRNMWELKPEYRHYKDSEQGS